MARIENYQEGVLRERWDTLTGTFTRWDASGTQVEQRALNANEVAQLESQDRLANRETLQTKATQALTANATFLAIATPTAAQNATQAKALTRQVNGLIRLQLAELSDITDT